MKVLNFLEDRYKNIMENNVIRQCERCKKDFKVNLSEEEKYGYRITWCSIECKDKFKKYTCKKCERVFYSYIKRTFCSDECRKDICMVCGKIYIRKNNETYCSEECKIKKNTHKCIVCEMDFYNTSSNPKYCSITCKNAFLSQQKSYGLCKNCKNIIKNLTNNKAEFCSDECEKKYNEKNNRRPLCKFCNKIIFNPEAQGKDYCSLDCRMKDLQKMKQKRREANSKDIDENILHEIVEFKVSTLLEQRKNIEKTFEWTINYFNINGFTESIKERIRKRDDNCCYICEDTTNLEVHHIVPRRLGGQHKEENLITLCTKCHRYIETNNKEYAIKKCFSKARKTFGIVDWALKEQQTNKEKFLEVKAELESIYKSVAEVSTYELEESLMKISELIDDIDDHTKIKGK